MPVKKLSPEYMDKIDGNKFKEMLYAALNYLNEQKSLLNSLNVFPVPDGDTGTNMYLTFLEAVKEVKKADTNDVSKITSALAKGALMGARGNSGVILSQLLRGFSLTNKSNKNLNAEILVKSLRHASDIAYQGVLKPVEGTILTVSREAAVGAEIALENELDIVEILQNTVRAARVALNKTPEQLPILKEAEVVDAGGQGYLTILQGMLKGLTGENIKKLDMEIVTSEPKKELEQEIKYCYCTELMIKLKEKNHQDIAELRKELQNYGDSLLVVGADEIIKIHIHTNHPGIILEYALKWGSLNDIKIDNMSLQSAEKKAQEQAAITKATDKIGIIAVSQGEGLENILRELGVNKIIAGGQSMNPSTNDFLQAINSIDTKEIILLPNNKNVISAAEQAASLSEKDVKVIPTKSLPEAISSLLMFDPEAELLELREEMIKAAKMVKSASITKAVKNSKINNLKIEKGDIIAIYQDRIMSVGRDYHLVLRELLQEIYDQEELLTIYYGKNIKEKEVNLLQEKLSQEFNFDEIEIYNGGQPLYPFIISLE